MGSQKDLWMQVSPRLWKSQFPESMNCHQGRCLRHVHFLFSCTCIPGRSISGHLIASALGPSQTNNRIELIQPCHRANRLTSGPAALPFISRLNRLYTREIDFRTPDNIGARPEPEEQPNRVDSVVLLAYPHLRPSWFTTSQTRFFAALFIRSSAIAEHWIFSTGFLISRNLRSSRLNQALRVIAPFSSSLPSSLDARRSDGMWCRS